MRSNIFILMVFFIGFGTAARDTQGESLDAEGTSSEITESKSLSHNRKPVKISVSIAPQAFLLERIASSRVSVNTVIDEDLSPHHFNLTPRQMAEIVQSEYYFTLGLPMEDRLEEKLTGIDSKLEFFDITKGIERRIMGSSCEHQGCGSNHGSTDPHLWMNPKNMMQMAINLREKLKSIDPRGKSVYREGCSDLCEELQTLHRELSQKLQRHRGEGIYVFHPAFGYFTDEYGLVQKAIQFQGKEPSARQLSQLIRELRGKNIKVIFVQEQFTQRAASKLAQAIGGRIEELDPLARNYIANLLSMARKISQALTTSSSSQ